VTEVFLQKGSVKSTTQDVWLILTS